MKLKELVKRNCKPVLLVWAAFAIMAAASYAYVSSVVKEQIDLYSHKEVKVYQNSLKSLIQANKDALVHTSAVMSMGLKRGAPNAERLEILKTLNEVFKAQPDIEDVFMSVYGFIDGDFIDGSGRVRGAYFNPKTAAWLRGAMLADGVHQTEPYIDPRSDRVVSALSMVVYDQKGESRGVMAVDFLFEPIIDWVSGYKVGEAGFGFLVNKSLKVMAHPDRSLVGKSFEELPGLAGFGGLLGELGSSVAIRQFKLDGEDYVVFFSRLDNGWYMGNLAPMSFYYSQVSSLLPVIAVIGSILALVLSVVLLKLNLAKALSEEESRSKSSFLARISHEIRTPMNAIIGLSELADRNYGQPQVRGHIKEIRRAGQLLLSLINDILDYSAIESGKFRVISVDYQLGRLLGDVLAIVSLKASEKRLRLDARIDPGLPRELRGDDRAIRQVLLNLLSNAIKYTPSGFVKLSAEGVPEGEGALRLIFTVEDSGVGISREDQGRLFGDFVRLSKDKLASEVEGTGLGLAIAKNLARLMSGDVEVESEPGRGSKFTASFLQEVVDPRPFEAIGDLGPALNAPEPPAAFLAPGARALVVDDVLSNLTVARGLLEPYGLEVAACLSGAEAVELESRQPSDLLLIDHMMPQMDGVETLRRIRALPRPGPAAPAIAFTANAMAGVKEMLLEQGFDDFLSKPVDSGDLAAALDKWLKPELKAPAPPAGPPAEAPEGAAGEGPLASALARAGLDVEVCRKRCGAREDSCVQTLKAFLTDAERLQRRLAEGEAASDLEELGNSAHALKSAAANIGALALSSEALELEAIFKAGRAEPARDGRLASFRGHLSDLAERLRAVLEASALERAASSFGQASPGQADPGAASLGQPGAGPGEGGPSGGQVGLPEAGGEIERIREALAANDAGLADRLVDSLERRADERLKAALSEVSYQILVSDYQAALRLIADLDDGRRA
jgi:signal transduction histidine kinase/CheY-like chemotaxis protein/HPt (histidine-containing phosphotransfer) domain-containing protein